MSTTAISMRGMAVLAFLCVMAVPARAQQPTAEQKQHTVKEGDTLWDLARQYFSDPFRWPLIFEANRGVVENPHRIFPSETLVIPGMPADATRVADAETAGDEPLEPVRSRFYTAPVRSGPTLISTEQVSTSLVQASEWLGAPWISDSASLPFVARVFKPIDPRLQKDRLRQMFHPQDELILNTFGAGTKAGDRLLALRLTRNLRGIGWVVEPQGVLHVDSVAETRAMVSVVSQFADLRIGDLAIPLPPVPEMPADNLVPVTGGPVGELIELLLKQPLVGTTEIAFVTLGAAQGITIGDELLAYIPERRENQRSPELLPEQAVGRMRVIKVTDQIATVRVIGLNSGSLREGLPVRVSRKVQ